MKALYSWERDSLEEPHDAEAMERSVLKQGKNFWIAPHLSISAAPSLALLLPFLTSGPDLGAWLDCWVSVLCEVCPRPQPLEGVG